MASEAIRVNNKAHTAGSHFQSLRAQHCTELSYRITVPADTFDLERFAKAIGASVESQGWDSAARSPKDSESTDYHLHVYWRPHFQDRSKTQLQVDVHCWPPESNVNHSEPYAEDFFDWVGQFFKEDCVSAHVHAEFGYPVGRWKSKVMALPITVPYEGRGAVIEGFSISLPSEPAGVRDVWLHLGKKTLELQFYADRPLRFRGFTPHIDVEAFTTIAKTLIEEQK